MMIDKILICFISFLSGSFVFATDLEKLYQDSFTFDRVAKNRWVLESANAFVIEDKYPQAPVHLLVNF